MHYTIKIFRHLYNNLPPLFPDDIEEMIKQSLEQFEAGGGVSLEELENEMRKYGYFVWPWNKAYRDFLEMAEYKIGDHFLLSHLSEDLQEKYNEFKEYGGTWHDLHSGRPAEFFTSEERAELVPAMVETKRKLREYVDRNLVGLVKKEYLKKVEKYNLMLNEIQDEIAGLKNLIVLEEAYPMLINEMRERIKDVENSLCLLGKELNFQEVKNMQKFFRGRKENLKRMEGSLKPMEINFYE
jgi:hypothetical protein